MRDSDFRNGAERFTFAGGVPVTEQLLHVLHMEGSSLRRVLPWQRKADGTVLVGSNVERIESKPPQRIDTGHSYSDLRHITITGSVWTGLRSHNLQYENPVSSFSCVGRTIASPDQASRWADGWYEEVAQ